MCRSSTQIDAYLITIGFTRSQEDSNLYYMADNDSQIAMLCLIPMNPGAGLAGAEPGEAITRGTIDATFYQDGNDWFKDQVADMTTAQP